MTSDPIIVSVPHCGTRFLKERLGIKDHIHTTSSWGTIWERTQNREVVVPLRPPVGVWRSWCRRHKHDNFPYAMFFVSWGLLQALDNMIDLDVICVDKCQDPRITDWRSVGNSDGDRPNWKLLKTDLRALHKLPIVERHYGSWP